jgi:YidC/Oxa1 family membrane protein insertase
MTDKIRVFLWVGLGLALWVNYSQYQIDYAPKPAIAASATTPGAAGASTAPSSVADSVPQASAAAPASGAEAVPAVPGAQPTATPAVETAAQLVHVVTDVLVLDIDLKGGELVRAELPGYPVVKGKEALVVLFNRDSAETNYILQSGLSGPDANRPTHFAQFTAPATRFELAPGQQELRVPLTWTDGHGVTVTKTFVFKRSFFGIDLEYAIDNKSATAWAAASYARIVRTDPPIERSMFSPDSFAFRGPAVWSNDKPGTKNHYQRLDIESRDDDINREVTDGWIAGMQHHFVSAVVPTGGVPYRYTMQTEGRRYFLGVLGPTVSVAPGAKSTLTEKLFVGPKLQAQLETLHPDLSRVADYTWLTLLAKPLFWLLGIAHSLIHNWGVAIILVTLVLKLLFYPLSEYAGRSMARMRAVAPRMKQLQETYKDDREKLGREMMELYKREKVNPLSGCLPMLIQMPVFLAFYWVLLESVEMRQAPFFGWLNDLSSRDPFFILPALNGVAMWFQQKLNPPPPDPVQAKVFQFMPIIFSVMFALFPAGLVLYWVTNTSLSILQQWNINRKLEGEKPKVDA